MPANQILVVDDEVGIRELLFEIPVFHRHVSGGESGTEKDTEDAPAAG